MNNNWPVWLFMMTSLLQFACHCVVRLFSLRQDQKLVLIQVKLFAQFFFCINPPLINCDKMSDNNEATAVSKLHKVREEIADFMPVVNVIGWLAFVELLNSIYGTVEECSETRKIVQWLFVAVSGIPINLLYHWQLAEDINAQRTNIEHLQGKYGISILCNLDIFIKCKFTANCMSFG